MFMLQLLLSRCAKPNWLAYCLSLVVCLSGCHRAIYDARSLPPSFRAPVVVDVQSLDLSRLASADVSSETVQTGDVLDVTVVTGAPGEIPESWPLRVGGDGTVNVPLVGIVPVAGKSLLGHLTVHYRWNQQYSPRHPPHPIQDRTAIH